MWWWRWSLARSLISETRAPLLISNWLPCRQCSHSFQMLKRKALRLDNLSWLLHLFKLTWVTISKVPAWWRWWSAYHKLRKTAGRHGSRFSMELAWQIWKLTLSKFSRKLWNHRWLSRRKSLPTQRKRLTQRLLKPRTRSFTRHFSRKLKLKTKSWKNSARCEGIIRSEINFPNLYCQ